MILSLDIGNTNIKAGYFLDNLLNKVIIFKDLTELFDSIKNERFMDAAISSVVPTSTEKIRIFIEKKFKITPYIISKDSLFNIRLDYKTPDTLGIDRICSLEAAFNMFNMNKDLEEGTFLLTIDFGTATTINIVAPPCNFIGGLIAPGINTMFSSLNNRTANLPNIDFSNYKSLIGNDTNSSIASGIITSTVGMIERTIRYLKDYNDAKVIKIFITGGNAEQVQPFLPEDIIFDEALVLKGANIIYNLNKKV